MQINRVTNNIHFKSIALDQSFFNLKKENQDKIQGVINVAAKHPNRDIFVSAKEPENLVLRVQKSKPLELFISQGLISINTPEYYFLRAMMALQDTYYETHGFTPNYYEDEIPGIDVLDEKTLEEITNDIVGIFDDMDYNPIDYN